MKNLIQRFTLAVTSLFFVTAIMVPVPAMAAEDVLSEACKVPESVLCKESKQAQDVGDNSIYGPNGLLTRVVRVISIALGIASVIVIIIGGMKYVLASGDPSKVSSAKDTVLYAVVGLVIASVAQGLIVFVLNKL